MGFKEGMADFMMGKMSAEQKKEMMDGMMGKFFAEMTGADKQKMMDSMMEKFMGTMSSEEKQGMMQSMMPKMMGSMMGGAGSGNPMMNMMGMMMGGMQKGGAKSGEASNETGSTEMPWDMCKKMMTSMSKTSELATFATPEVRQLFEEWAAQIESEVWAYIQTHPDEPTEKIAEHFKLSVESITYFLTRLAAQGKINLKAGKK